MSSGRKIAFLSNHGVEVRHFLLSGLSRYLQESNEVVFIQRKEVYSQALDGYLLTFELAELRLPFKTDLRKRIREEAYMASISKSRKKIRGIGYFHNFKKESNKPVLKDYLLGNHLVFSLAHRWLSQRLKQHYTVPEIQDWLKSQQVTDLIMLDYNSPFQLMMAYSALEAGVRVSIVINTLKSYFVNDYIPFPLYKLYAWDADQTRLFRLSNAHQKTDSIVNGGNPYYSYFTNSLFLDQRQNLFAKYPQLQNRKLIVYSLIYEKMYGHEIELLKKLDEVIDELFPEGDRPLVVIRRNPFEESRSILDQILTLKNFCITDHFWERDVALEWSIQAIQGELEWKLLLKEAALVMNIPSMAGYEAILSGTPVLNIGFDQDGYASDDLRHFTAAPFMKTLLQSQFIKVCDSVDMLRDQLPLWLDLKSKYSTEEIRDSIGFILFSNENI